MGYSGKFDGQFEIGSQAWEDYALHADEALKARAVVKGGSMSWGLPLIDRLRYRKASCHCRPTVSYSYGQTNSRTVNGGLNRRDRRSVSASESRFAEPPQVVRMHSDRGFRRGGVPHDDSHWLAVPIVNNDPSRSPATADFLQGWPGRRGFTAGIQAAVERIALIEFLFRIESVPRGPSDDYRSISNSLRGCPFLVEQHS